MTPDERQLLADTAKSVIRLVESHSDTVAGTRVALLEMFRAQFAADDRKEETLARLRITLSLLRQTDGRGTGFLEDLIGKLEPWTGPRNS
jgi:hypothetical protein